MNIVVITNNDLRQELLAQGLQDVVTVQYTEEVSAIEKAGCYIDLLFQPTEERINKLKQLQPALIIINAVSLTSKELPAGFVRMNGWPGFLKSNITEASTNDETIKSKAENIFACFGKKTEWVADIPGFVTARVVSMIINEAYFALNEKVSSKEEIDTAMKLGTNYPYGPFEWSQKIGLQNIHALLVSLSTSNSRYEPAELLKKEATAL